MDVEQFFTFLKQSELTAAEQAQLRAQITPEMVYALGTAVFPDVICQVCQQLLPEYLYDQLMAGELGTKYGWLERHLVTCETCAALVAELTPIITAAYAGDIPVAESYPTFDFSFLDQPTVTANPIWQTIHKTGAQINKLAENIRITITQGIAFFAQIPATLQPASIPLRATRDQVGEYQGKAQVLPIPDAQSDLTIRLTIGAVVENQASLDVQVIRYSSQQPIANTRVSIRDLGGHILASGQTDEAGHLQTGRLITGDYTIEVRYQGNSWELPISFNWQA